MIHEKAAIGFSKAGDSYEKGRPNYPKSAIDFLASKFQLDANISVLDVGAGTGIFTKLLCDLGVKVTAVEPLKSMRAKLQLALTGVETHSGTAEALPLGNSSIDHIMVAQAFHWFKGHDALREFYRVLKPGGKIGLIWNVRDESVPWVAELTRIIDPHEGDAPRYRTFKWAEAFAKTSLFTPLQRETFEYEQVGSLEMILDRVKSISFIAALPNDLQTKVLAEVRTLMETHPQTAGLTEFRLPYRTEIYWCDRKD